MRLLSTFVALSSVAQALASPSYFEVKPGDEAALKPIKPEAPKYHYQSQQRGEIRIHQGEDGVWHGWHRRSVEGEEPASSTLLKRKEGVGGGKNGGFSSGGRRSGGFPSRSKIGRVSSQNRGSGSNRESSTGIAPRGIESFFGGVATVVGLGWLLDAASSSYSTGCPASCRCDSMDDFRLYFNTPSTYSTNSSAVVSLATQWHAGYQDKLRTRLEKEAGLISIPDPRYQCGWYSVMDVSKAVVHRGNVNMRSPNGTASHADINPELRGKILNILNTTYPTTEVGLILGCTLFPVAFLVVAILTCMGCFCFGRIKSCCGRKQKAKRVADAEQAHDSFELQNKVQQNPVRYGQQATQPAAQYSFPYGQTPYNETLYGETPYGQTPYGQTPNGQTSWEGWQR